MSKAKSTTDAVDILQRRYVEKNPFVEEALNEQRANYRIAKAISELRQKLGLTQKQFAELVGTTASVICRLEDADYEGHSTSMLERIAAAVNHQVELQVRFVPRKEKEQASKRSASKKTPTAKRPVSI
jgi:DNA-binding transcriptional regulator YiaG